MDVTSRTLLHSLGILKNVEAHSAPLVENSEEPAHELPEGESFSLVKGEMQDLLREGSTFDEKIGFELGWDYARHLGWVPEIETNKHFLGGFQTAKSKAAHGADRYVRKWLQLRYSAWRRGKVFDELVTPAFLELIDRPLCPILGTVLTHSTGLPSDWSIDRLNNLGGYAIGNLAVMSTEANAAKSNHSMAEILLFSRASGPSGGLDPLYWKRMVSLLAGAFSVVQSAELLAPLCIIPPPYLPLNLFQEVQLVLVREIEKNNSPLIAKLIKINSDRADSRHLKKVLNRLSVESRQTPPTMEIWLDSALFGALKDWYQRLTPELLAKMRLIIEKALGSEQVSLDMRARWGLETSD